jgi:hypothetical protein
VQHEIQTLPFPTEKNSKGEMEKREETGETKKQNSTKHTATYGRISRSFNFLTTLSVLRLYSVG